MRRGSVVVDLAASQGGNVEVPESSDAGAPEITHHGVLVLRPRGAASHLAFHASQAFSHNIGNLLLHLTAEGEWKTDLAEEIAAGWRVGHLRAAAAATGRGLSGAGTVRRDGVATMERPCRPAGARRHTWASRAGKSSARGMVYAASKSKAVCPVG